MHRQTISPMDALLGIDHEMAPNPWMQSTGQTSAAIIQRELGEGVAGFPISTLGVADRSPRSRLFLRDLLYYLEGGGYVANHRDSRVLVVPLGQSVSEIGERFHEIPHKLLVQVRRFDGQRTPGLGDLRHDDPRVFQLFEIVSFEPKPP